MLTTLNGERRWLAAAIALCVAAALVASATAGAYPVMPDGERIPGPDGPASNAPGGGAFESAIDVEAGTGSVAIVGVCLAVLVAASIAVVVFSRSRTVAAH